MEFGVKEQEREDEQAAIVERNLAQSGPTLQEASAAREQLHAAERNLNTSFEQMAETLRERPVADSVLAKVDGAAAEAAVSEMQHLLRSAETAFRQAEIAAVSTRNQLDAGVSLSTRSPAEALN